MLSDTEVDLDWRGDTPADLEGEPVLPPGKYHIILTSIKREGQQPGESPCLRVRYRVLNGTAPSARGAAASERFSLSDAALKRLKILAHRLGLVKDSDLGTRAGPMDFRPAIGRELVVEVVNEEFVSKKEQQRAADDGRAPKPALGSKFTFAGFWAPEDQRAAGVPLDPAAAAQIRREIGLGTPATTAYQPRQTSLPGVTAGGDGAYNDI